MTQKTINPTNWPEPTGYANAIAATGRVVALAGQIGWDPVTQELVSDDFVAQAGQAFRNIATLLGAAGADITHLVRLTWYITDRSAYLSNRRALGAAYREVFGRHFPAMSVIVVSGLLETRALLEIEATAVVPTSPD